MFVSIFDLFKIGIGPSSSHTLAPMKAAATFVDDLNASGDYRRVTRVSADVYGSLSLTGKGHFTDNAIVLGLAGADPVTCDVDAIDDFMAAVESSGRINLGGLGNEVEFSKEAIAFHDEFLPRHENAMSITAYAGEDAVYSNTYYSLGGGFIADDASFGKTDTEEHTPVPYEFSNAEEMVAHCERDSISIAEMAWRNELAVRSEEEIREHVRAVWAVMTDGIERGLTAEGVLPGEMQVPRRAPALKKHLESTPPRGTLTDMGWINVFAMAVNETNASCGRVVTAPTNGACGTIPAVMAYYDKCVAPLTEDDIADFMLTCTQIGALYKMNASMSGAEVGCQGEVGVACSMAAAGLAHLFGGTVGQVCSAAEIGMEHNLGLTCDPVCGQVQIPCIERNAIAAIKATSACTMAMQRESQPVVSLDRVIATMYQTGKDMHSKYRETSLGGLAIQVTPDQRPILPCS